MMSTELHWVEGPWQGKLAVASRHRDTTDGRESGARLANAQLIGAGTDGKKAADFGNARYGETQTAIVRDFRDDLTHSTRNSVNSPFPLIVPQRDDGIDFRGASSRKVACEQCGDCQYRC
jgi:hypothetical protein